MKVAHLKTQVPAPSTLRSPKAPEGGPPPGQDQFEFSTSRGLAAVSAGAVGLVGGLAVGRTLATPGVFDASQLLEVSLRPDSLVGVVGGLAGLAILAAGAYRLSAGSEGAEEPESSPSPAQRIWAYNAAALGCITGGVGGAALLGALGQATGIAHLDALAMGVGAGLGAAVGGAGGYRLFS